MTYNVFIKANKFPSGTSFANNKIFEDFSLLCVLRVSAPLRLCVVLKLWRTMLALA
jgi:hypothetical protein